LKLLRGFGLVEETDGARTEENDWREHVCAENNPHVQVGKETYFLSANGLLMPAKKDQAPPDLRYFNETRK
jgi:hypothetical protein